MLAAVEHQSIARCGARRLLFSALLLLAPTVGVSTQALAVNCTIPEAAMAQNLFEDWNAALKTQHPDRVTRLFATDGALLGFASTVPRAGYMPIRDYFLYFLQFEPKARIADRRVETGCNFLIDQGSYVWTLKSRSTGTVETREARYRFIYELTGGQWQIAQHVDELVPGAQIAGFAVPPPLVPRVAVVDTATGTAVAGFVKRVESATPQPPVSRISAPAAKASAPATSAGDEPAAAPQPRGKPRAAKKPPVENPLATEQLYSGGGQ